MRQRLPDARRALVGLDEPRPHRTLGTLGITSDGGPTQDDAVKVVINTGSDLEPIDGDWHKDFEFPEDGSFELHVRSGYLNRATLHGRVLDDACTLLEQFHALSPDDCKPGEVEALVIDYVRVVEECRGWGYGTMLVEAAVKAFLHRGWWVYADCYSQLIYKNLSHVLGAPTVVIPAEGFEREDDEVLYRPSHAAVLDVLDALPVEDKLRSYKSGYQLGNSRHAHVLWQVKNLPKTSSKSLEGALEPTQLVYHATTQPYAKPTELRGKTGDFGPGFYFATDVRDTRAYGPVVYQARVALTNPLSIADAPSETVRRVQRALKVPDDFLQDSLQGDTPPMAALMGFANTLIDMGELSSATLLKFLHQKLGYDGLYVANAVIPTIAFMGRTIRAHGDYVVVFMPEQILTWERIER